MSASPHFASPSEAIDTVWYIKLFLLCCPLQALRIVLSNRACCLLVSILQVLENKIGHTAYFHGSGESTPIAATVALNIPWLLVRCVDKRWIKTNTHLCGEMNLILSNCVT